MAQSHPLYCIFRYDDYSTRDRPILTQVLERIETYAVPHTFGIIPHPFEDWDHPERQTFVPFTKETVAAKNMRRLCIQGYIEPALHGWNHEKRFSPNQRLSEFAGLPYEQQLEKIGAGKARLERELEQKIETFIPPYNTYDAWTLKACEACMIQVFSGSLGEETKSDTLVFLPQTCSLRHCEKAIHQWCQIKDQFSEPTFLIVGYHSFDFQESGEAEGYYTLDRLEQLFRVVTSSQEVVLLTLGQAGHRFSPQLTPERYQEGHWYYTKHQTRYDSLRNRFIFYDAAPFFYYPTAHYHRLRKDLTRRNKLWPLWLLSPAGVLISWHIARRRIFRRNS